MRKYAFLENNVVVSVETLSEQSCIEMMKSYDLTIDVEDLLVTPQIGWVLSGNILIPGADQSISMKDIVKAKLKSYQSKAPELLIEAYATNTLLGMTTAQSDASFELMEDVIFILCQGAWPTAIYRLQKKADAGLITQEVANNWIAVIQAAL